MFLIVFFSGFYIMSNAHEQAHVAVCNQFRGNISDLQVNIFTGSHVKCNLIVTPEYSLAQSYVDSFGYQFQMGIGIMMLLIFIIGFVIIFVAGDNYGSRLDKPSD